MEIFITMLVWVGLYVASLLYVFLFAHVATLGYLKAKKDFKP